MFTIKSIPAFNDNYIWLIENNDQVCSIVDPGDANPVIQYLTEHKLELDSILITHHHNDHTGGITELKQRFPNAKVIGPKDEDIRYLTDKVGFGDSFTLFDSQFDVLELPGHTAGHIGFVATNTQTNNQHIFCGDVLFSAGCGRIFEGTHQQMYQSLVQLAQFKDSTLVYPAHEYTSSNLAFALAVEPDNSALLAYQIKVDTLRANNIATLPTTIGLEKEINPFLRVEQPRVIEAVKTSSKTSLPLDVFTALREWKNTF